MKADRERAFVIWYEQERNVDKALQIIAREFKSAPSKRTLYNWIRVGGWIERADSLDAEVERRANAKLIRQKNKILERHAQAGRTLATLGISYFVDPNDPTKLLKDKVTNATVALRAVQLGTDIERKAESFPDWIIDIVGASDEQLIQRYHDLIARIGGNRSGDDETGD